MLFEPSPPAEQRSCPACGAPVAADFRYCTRCGTPIDFGATVAGAYPLRFDVQYPEKLSRLLIFVKLILAIPQFLVIYALGTVSGVITFLSFFAILFTRRYPRGMFDLVVGFNRWSANVYAYVALMRDEYPPFSSERGKYPVVYDVDYPERLSRWLIFVKWFLALGHQFVLSLLSILGFFSYVFAWFGILFTGRYPRTFFNFNVGLMRWYLRVGAYTGLMRDEFPPFSKRADARPGTGRAIALSIVFALLMMLVYAAAIVALTTIDPQTTTITVAYEQLDSGSAQATARVEGTHVSLTDVEDPYDGPAYLPGTSDPIDPGPGSRFIAFDMTITNVDALFTSVDEDAFSLRDSTGVRYDAVGHDSVISGNELSEGDRISLRVIFEIDDGAEPLSLTYAPGLAAYLPFGERVRFVFR
jgi:hypothetical protein